MRNMQQEIEKTKQKKQQINWWKDEGINLIGKKTQQSNFKEIDPSWP